MFALLIVFFMSPLAAQPFIRITNAGPIVTDSIISAGLSWNDYNNDGHPDMYVSGVGTQMYRNNGDGTFTRITDGDFVNTLTITNSGVWADYDNDGFVDLALSHFSAIDSQGVLTQPVPKTVYRNSGPPHYTLNLAATLGDSGISLSASWVDYDRDGDTDLFFPHTQNYSDHFFRNDGGVFTELANLPFVKTRSSGGTESWVDYDNDGDEDIYLVNRNFTPNELYKSLLKETGDPNRFEAVTGTPLTSEGFINDFGPSWADYDNDGDLDMLLASAQQDRLYRNDGDGNFASITNTPIVSHTNSSASGAWGDFDNDGDLDLFVPNAETLFTNIPALYRNDGGGTFVLLDSSEVGELISPLPGAQGAMWWDYDLDGDLDIYVIHFTQPSVPGGTPQPNYLFRNESGGGNHWLEVSCTGELTNRSAIGAQIRLKAAIGGSAVWQMRTIATMGQAGLNTQDPSRAHFGLGDAAVVDSLIIEWPSGIIQVLTQVAADQRLSVTEDVSMGFLRADFSADTLIAVNSDTLGVQFTDRSIHDPTFPVTFREWDFDGDGIIDAGGPAPFWTYTRADTYTVSLTVSNAIQSDTLIRPSYIRVTGLVPIIAVDPGEILLGSIDVNIPTVDTMFYVYNRGGAADTVDLSLDPGNVNPPSAVSVSPQQLPLAPGDSGAVVFTVTPPMLPPNGLFLTPKVLIDSRRGYGTTHFEKTIRFRITGQVSVGDRDNSLPRQFTLAQNYPNPFNPETTIIYGLPKKSRVVLKIYDVLGREVRTLVNGEEGPGWKMVPWDGRDDAGRLRASGIYFYRLSAAGVNQAANFQATRKLLLLR